MMGNEGNEGNDVIEDIDVLGAAISCYPILTPVLMHWHPTHTLKKSSSKPVLRTGTILQ